MWIGVDRYNIFQESFLFHPETRLLVMKQLDNTGKYGAMQLLRRCNGMIIALTQNRLYAMLMQDN